VWRVVAVRWKPPMPIQVTCLAVGVAVAGKLALAMLIRATRWVKGGARLRRNSEPAFRRKRLKA
jgi:hypothetical protein